MSRMYLRDFSFPIVEDEDRDLQFECSTEYYPYRVLSQRGLFDLAFSPVTILYGGNGSGKSTALNVMASRMGLRRDSPYEPGPYFSKYLTRTDYNSELCEGYKGIPKGSAIICSEDIFDMTLEIRGRNRALDIHRDELSEEWVAAKTMPEINLESIHGRMYDDWARIAKLKHRRQTLARTLREEVRPNIKTGSNGENAFESFVQRLNPGMLYLLDEPENSLSAAWQAKLSSYLETLVRFENCQIVIATHSPFLLSIAEARVYDLDSPGTPVRQWTELENVRMYYELFKAHDAEFGYNDFKG